MGKFYAKIGYAISEETAPGVWTKKITEKCYSGDIIKNVRRNFSSGNLNDDVEINNTFSIIADPYAMKNIGNMIYIEWIDSLWKIKSISIEYPRIVIEIGGVYNGEQA